MGNKKYVLGDKSLYLMYYLLFKENIYFTKNIYLMDKWSLPKTR